MVTFLNWKEVLWLTLLSQSFNNVIFNIFLLSVVVEKTCGPPPSIPSGYPVSRDGEKYFHGETVTYECEENFVIVGTNPAKYLHGEWKLPVCAGRLQ